jgi:hypothetical protein
MNSGGEPGATGAGRGPALSGVGRGAGPARVGAGGAAGTADGGLAGTGAGTADGGLGGADAGATAPNAGSGWGDALRETGTDGGSGRSATRWRATDRSRPAIGCASRLRRRRRSAAAPSFFPVPRRLGLRLAGAGAADSNLLLLVSVAGRSRRPRSSIRAVQARPPSNSAAAATDRRRPGRGNLHPRRRDRRPAGNLRSATPGAAAEPKGPPGASPPGESPLSPPADAAAAAAGWWTAKMFSGWSPGGREAGIYPPRRTTTRFGPPFDFPVVRRCGLGH